MNKQPDIYLFNPTCEYAIANGNDSWQPTRLLQNMENDLATLPMFFAKPQDFILVNRQPSENFLKTFNKIGLNLPNFISIKEILQNNNQSNFSFGKILPWGWSPVAHKLLAPLKPFCSDEFKNSVVYNWKPEYKNLYSKGFSLTILKELKTRINSDLLIHSHLLPEICTTQKEIEILLKRWGELMVKAPWSSSGRGLQPIRKKLIHPKVWDKLLGIISDQSFAIVEPYLNKVADLSFQFELKKGKVYFLGISNFSADKNGQFQGNQLNGLPDKYEKELIEFIEQIPNILISPLIEIIESTQLAIYYEGNFGVDTLIYKDENNQLKINPCLEINVRQNMGLLSLELEKLISQDKKAVFKTFYQPGVLFQKFISEMENKYPLKVTSNKIESGFFPLTEGTQFGAYILI